MSRGRLAGLVAWVVSFAISLFVAVQLGQMVLAWVIVGLFVVWVVAFWAVEKQNAARRSHERRAEDPS